VTQRAIAAMAMRYGGHVVTVTATVAESANSSTPDVLNGDAGQGFGCLPQRRSRGGASVGAQQREAVKQQVEGRRSTRRRREGQGGAADLHEDIRAGEMPRHARRAPGDQVGLAREF
jgi:hypothetical protein